MTVRVVVLPVAGTLDVLRGLQGPGHVRLRNCQRERSKAQL
jgi:hypothetical protein